MAFQLRLLNNSDYSMIKGIYQNAEIMRHIGRIMTDEQVEPLFDAMLLEMENKKALYQVITNTETDEKAGFLSMHWRPDDESIVSGMIVLPAFQNKGLCKWAQMTAMRQINNHFPAKTCTVYISAENEAASTSYKNMGFVVVANTLKSKKYIKLNRWDFNMEIFNQ